MNWIVALVGLAVGVLVGWAVATLLVRRFELGRLRQLREEAKQETTRTLEGARADANALKRSAELAAKEEILRAKDEWEKEVSKRRSEVERTERRLDDREGLLDRKYWFDELYENVFVKTVLLKGLFAIFQVIDRDGVDGAVNGVANTAVATGRTIRRVQTGQLQLYGLIMGIGIVVIVLAIYYLA